MSQAKCPVLQQAPVAKELQDPFSANLSIHVKKKIQEKKRERTIVFAVEWQGLSAHAGKFIHAKTFHFAGWYYLGGSFC